MGRLVRLYKGQWSKSQQGVWSFNQDHTVTVQDILVKVNESIETLLNLVRCVFGIRETPTLITFKLPPWMDGP